MIMNRQTCPRHIPPHTHSPPLHPTHTNDNPVPKLWDWNHLSELPHTAEPVRRTSHKPRPTASSAQLKTGTEIRRNGKKQSDKCNTTPKSANMQAKFATKAVKIDLDDLT